MPNPDWTRLVRLHLQRARLAPTAEADLIDELTQHLEQRYGELRARGLSEADAEREVEAELTNDEDLLRAARRARSHYAEPIPFGQARGGLLTGLANDIRIGFRVLLRNRGFALAAIVTLAIGIGANTAIFGMIDAVLLRAWPFADPDGLVIVWETDRASSTVHEPASWPDIQDFRERARTVTEIAAFRGTAATVRLGDAEPVRLAGVAVTPNFLALLGVQPLLGTGFRAGDGMYGGTGLTVMLSEHIWRSRFQSDPSVVGRDIIVNGTPASIAGVVPSAAELGIRQVHTQADYGGEFSASRVDVWLSMIPTADRFPRTTHPYFTLARLAPSATVVGAQRELAAIAADLEAAYPENQARGVNVQSFGDVVFGPVRPAMLVLFVAALLVLIVTCANVANLLLARTSARMRDVAVRRALGASSAHIVRQQLAEAFALTAVGTVFGMAIAWLALRLVVSLAPADVPRLTAASLDLRVLAFTVVTAAVVALVFGGIPALRLRGFGMRQVLQAQPDRMTEGRGGRRVRATLVVGQVALAVALFAAAGLLLRSYAALLAVDPGFRSAGVLKAEYQLTSSRYPFDGASWPNLPAINGFHATLLEKSAALPGVTATAVAGAHPLDPGFTNSFVIVGREAESEDFPEIRTRFISPGYLQTLAVPLIRGRDLATSDDAVSPRVGLINAAAAARFFTDTDPIGHVMGFWGIQWRIVGVIGDERFKGIDQESEPALYVPYAQAPMQTTTLLLRTTRDPVQLMSAVRQLFRELDPEVSLFAVEPLAKTVSATMAQPRFTTALLGIFAGVTVLLALIGVHGLLAYTVAQRTRELGIRIALGATRGEIRGMVLRQGLRLAAAGVVIGVVGALLGTRLIASMLFGVTATDPATFVLVTIAVLATAAGAAWFPARRAIAVDPIHALRD